MPYKPLHNPRVIKNVEIRTFSGVGGPSTQVIRKADRRGHDISGHFSNEQYDLDCNNKVGQLTLRPGTRKMSLTGYAGSITTIFQLVLGGISYRGFTYAGRLQFNEIPSPPPWPEDPFELPPVDPISWPPTFPPTDPVDDRPSLDPSAPLRNQVCVEHETWAQSPTALTFTAPYAETPSSKLYYWVRSGWVTELYALTRNLQPHWIDILDGGYTMGYSAPCEGYLMARMTIGINAKDSSHDWLAPGVYSWTMIRRKIMIGGSLTTGDIPGENVGVVLTKTITFTVTKPHLTASGTVDLIMWRANKGDGRWLDDPAPPTATLGLANTGTYIAPWTSAVVPVDATLAPSTGSLAAGASTSVVVTPVAALEVGTHTGDIGFTETKYGDVTTVPFQIKVLNLPGTLYVWCKYYTLVNGAWIWQTTIVPMGARFGAGNVSLLDWEVRWSYLTQYLQRVAGEWQFNGAKPTGTSFEWEVAEKFVLYWNQKFSSVQCYSLVASDRELTVADDPRPESP